MIKTFILSSLFASGMVLLVGIPIVSAQEQEKKDYVCEGPYKKNQKQERQKPTKAELRRILEDHEKWVRSLRSEEREGERANLCEADLREAQLQGANLFETHLQGADLREAQLQEADLGKAELQGANLRKAELQGANLWKAQLQGADLREAQLKGANMANADVQDVVFELKPNSLPSIPSLATTKNLSTMTYEASSHALVELREALKEKGMRDQEREVTYAIEHTKREKAWSEGSARDQIEAGFKYIMFEITSDYGMTPGGPLRILVFGTLVLSFLYGWVFRLPLENTKIFAVASQPVFEDFHALVKNLPNEKIGHEKKFPITYTFLTLKSGKHGRVSEFVKYYS